MRIILAFLLLASPALAAEPKVHRDLPYVEPKNERQALDVYAPAEGKDHPVVLWIHGGGWRAGNKTAVQKKPEAFVEKGFVFVSTNYRFVPNVTVQEMTGDIAKAIRWTHDHAKEYGGDPDTIFVMGHSAGAHLAALVCTDERYLKAEGLPLSVIKGCVPVDTAAYDVTKKVRDMASARPRRVTLSPFGERRAATDSHTPLPKGQIAGFQDVDAGPVEKLSYEIREVRLHFEPTGKKWPKTWLKALEIVPVIGDSSLVSLACQANAFLKSPRNHHPLASSAAVPAAMIRR